MLQKDKNNLFEEIYRSHFPMVYQMCLGFVKGERESAHDLSQEVFIIIWKNLNKFKGDSSYKTWIYRITVNACLQYVKRNKHSNNFLLSEVEDRMDFKKSVDEQHSDYQFLYDAIGKLNELDRLIIMMVLENQSYEEMATILGIKSSNLRVKVHRIKKKLEQLLE